MALEKTVGAEEMCAAFIGGMAGIRCLAFFVVARLGK